MREEISVPCAKPARYQDRDRLPQRVTNAKGGANSLKAQSASSWRSKIVKGFSADSKSQLHQVIPKKKISQENSGISDVRKSNGASHLRVKRNTISDMRCSANGSLVNSYRFRSSSGEIFLELENLRSLLHESKERELKLQDELAECRKTPRNPELEKELQEKVIVVDNLSQKLATLESEKLILTQQVASLTPVSKKSSDEISHAQSLEMEVLKLKRVNKELQFQRRDLAFRLSSMENHPNALSRISESDIISKMEAEASSLRDTNEDLCKQVEGLQMTRLNEVEELVYLRWVNSCLRNEIQNLCLVHVPNMELITSSEETIRHGDGRRNSLLNSEDMLNLRKNTDGLIYMVSNDDFKENCHDSEDKREIMGRRHSITGPTLCNEDTEHIKRRQSIDILNSSMPSNIHEARKFVDSDTEIRGLRVPNPPPMRCYTAEDKEEIVAKIPLPPPPPPPPPPNFQRRNSLAAVQRAPQVVEFYHSLMRRDSKRDSLNGGLYEFPGVGDVHSNMISEIENRSSYVLSIKSDVETQGEFVKSLIMEVNRAAFQDIEDVVAFVKWLDDELCFLVDERAVLKHFDWPERKADTLREAAFGYRDLKKLESEVTHFHDDPRVSCDVALKKIGTLSEKVEHTVYNIQRCRDQLTNRCKEFEIPVDWMLDNGILARMKLGSLKLAKKYMMRVASEIQLRENLEKDPSLDYVLLQGVRFAFKVHQFAGGFDYETMQAFEELRDFARVMDK